MRKFTYPLRLLVSGSLTLVIPFLSILLATALIIAIGLFLEALGNSFEQTRAAFLLLSFLILIITSTLWATSTAAGGFILLTFEVFFSNIFKSLRSRVVVAVTSLLAFIAVLTALTQYYGDLFLIWVEKNLADGYLKDMQDADTSLSEATEAFGWLFFSLALNIVLPAVISISSKLIDSAMGNIDTLSSAFDQVSQGNLETSIQSKGSLEFSYMADRFNSMVSDLAMSRKMEQAFGAYVSDHVLEHILAQHGDSWLEATSKEATVMFVDIRGFTALCESFTPGKIMALLNTYFSKIIPVIDSFDGYLDKFIGDAVVVVFNGPIHQPNHASLCAQCALAIQKAIHELNQEGTLPDQKTLHAGIGIATGPMVTGNLGSRTQMEYTVIGNTVNLSSRLTDIAPKDEIWISEQTAQILKDTFIVTAQDPIQVKGKTHHIVPYVLIGENGSGTFEDTTNTMPKTDKIPTS